MSAAPDILPTDSIHLTVNKRLAAALRERHDQAQLAAGRSVWASIEVLPWRAWLASRYTDLLDRGVTERDLLGPAQEHLLWLDALRDLRDPPILLDPHAAARSAMAAFALCCDWQVDDPALAGAGDDTRIFLAWRRAFMRRLDAAGQMAAAQLPALLHTAVANGDLAPPAAVSLHGFDALPPALWTLLDALRGADCTVLTALQQDRGAVCQRIDASDREAEIRLAARWASRRLAARPTARIAVIAPALARQRNAIDRIFGELLTPQAHVGVGRPATRHEISLGTPLAAQALVADALALLGLAAHGASLESVGRLLRSSFVGGHPGEWDHRARFDADLRDQGRPRLTLHRLRHVLQRYDAADPRHCPDLATRVEAVIDWQSAQPTVTSPPEWAARLQQVLRLFGWPGDAPLDSVEFQQHERLQALFSAFSALAKVRPTLSLGEAISLLRLLAAETVFQPQSAGAPVRILGPLEAAGLTFDGVWLLGLDDQSWPAAAAPNPLLPLALQRERDMPHASPAHELAFAGLLTRRIASASLEVVASHARRDGERELRPSPLIRHWQMADPTILCGDGADVLAPFAARGPVTPMPPPALGTPPIRVRGGASLLAAQAACPFRAVAAFRLDAAPLAESSHAPDAAQTGNLVHALLQHVWQRIGSSAALHALAPGALHALVADGATQVLAAAARQRPDLFTPRFVELETQRLVRLIGAWLDAERTREQGFEVAALEQQTDVEVGGLTLRIRADRIDRLDDGSLAVIDYKTGAAVSHEGWFDARVSEPQLPLYCIDKTTPVGAAVLARVRLDRTGCRFVGVSPTTPFAPGVGPSDGDADLSNWPALLGHWRSALSLLADEIRAGRAQPTPSPQACAYCAFGALCRVGADTEAAANG